MSRQVGRWAFIGFVVLTIAGIIGVIAFSSRLRVLPHRAPGLEMVYQAPADLNEQIAGVIRQRLGGRDNVSVHAIGNDRVAIRIWREDGSDWELQSDALDIRGVAEPMGALAFHRVLPSDSPVAYVMRDRDTLAKLPGDTCHWSRVDERNADPKMYAGATRVQDATLYLLLDDTPGLCMTSAAGAARWAVVSAEPSKRENGALDVSFRLDAEGAKQFGALTGACMDQPMAISVDDVVYAAPTVRSVIPGGQCVISGGMDGFTGPAQARLVSLLGAGTLPAPLLGPPEETLQPVTVPPRPINAAVGGAILAILLAGLALAGYAGFLHKRKPIIEVLGT